MTIKTFISTVVLTLALSLLFVRVAYPQAASGRIGIVAKRFEFEPGEVSVKKGVQVTLVLTSKDADHGLKFRDLNLVLTAKKGETKEFTFTPEKTGTFIGQCSVFCGSGHGGMKMTLHVTE